MKTPMGESGKDFINTDMRTNEDRAEDAELALRVSTYQQSTEEGEWDTAIVDLLADLMHLHQKAKVELSFSALYETARMYFEEEVKAEEIEEIERKKEGYLVKWAIEVEACTHREAAEEALKIQRDPDSMATVFFVENTETNEREEIDTGEEEN